MSGITTSFGVSLQLMNASSKVLLVGYYLCLKNEDGHFRSSEISRLLQSLRVPSPVNVSQTLSRMASQGLVIKHAPSKRWALTPIGRREATSSGFTVSDLDIEFAVVSNRGTSYFGVQHSVVPPQFAPANIKPAVEGILEDFPFESSVFLITRFPKKGRPHSDLLAETISQCRKSCAQFGLNLHVASDRNADDQLYGNIAAHMWASMFGIAILEDLEREDSENGLPKLNDNVLIEVGSMLMTGRRCAILKDITVDRTPSDLVGLLYKSVNLRHTESVATAVETWITNDIRLG